MKDYVQKGTIMKESSYLQGRDDLAEKFKKIPFLKAFSKEQIHAILNLSRMRRYEPGEEIVVEGSRDRWIYVIVIGGVKVFKEGKQVAILDKVGDVFGEMAVLDSGERSATVKASAETVCLAFDVNHLDEMNLPDLAGFYVIFYRMLAELLANRLRYATEELARHKGKLELMEFFVEQRWY